MKSSYTFFSEAIQESDQSLIEKSISGDKKALEKLIRKHQSWIYNISLNMVEHPEEAADITQEVLIKMLTKLSSFKGKSKFRTWLYRIVKNHFLNTKKQKYERETIPFETFASGLDAITDRDLHKNAYEVENKVLVKEAKISCMKAMLLCLSPEQRLIFIMGELFEFPDSIGSEIMEMSKANFRTKLHRARKQLYGFMDNQCGLINTNNPCRCIRKTVGFIEKGYVDPKRLKFHEEVIAKVEEIIPEKTRKFEQETISAYQKLYQEHPFLKSPEALEDIRKLISSNKIKETFDLN